MSREPIRLAGVLKDHDYFERGHCPTCGGQDVYNALKEAMRDNERLRNVIVNLEPLREIDWHGKWRIHACLDAIRDKESDNGN